MLNYDEYLYFFDVTNRLNITHLCINLHLEFEL